MPRYSVPFRAMVLKKLLPPENRSALSIAREYTLSVGTIYGWRAKMGRGSLRIEVGALSNRDRPLEEKRSLLLEAGRTREEGMGEWMRENKLHSQHLAFREQKVREGVTKMEKQEVEEMQPAKKKNRQQERECARTEKALAEAAISITV